MDTTSSKVIARPLTSYDRAALVTEAVELRVERVRKHLASFTASAINAHGFYEEPFARRRDLSDAGDAIKEAIEIILNNRWPDDDDEADETANPEIQRLRQKCTYSIREIIQNLRTIEQGVNDAEDSPRRLAQIVRCFTDIKKQIEAVDCILYNTGYFASKSPLQ